MENPNEKMKLDFKFVIEVILAGMRAMLGGWMIINGLNHFLPMMGLPPFYPQPLGTLHWSNVMLVSMIETGLFDLAKIAEVFVGLCLVFNRFVPLALAISLPVSFIVFYNSIALNYRYERLFSTYMAVWCTYMTIILMIANYKHYLPLLQWKSEQSLPKRTPE